MPRNSKLTELTLMDMRSKVVIWILGVVCVQCVSIATDGDDDTCSLPPKPPDVLYSGDLQVIGLFDLHDGLGCKMVKKHAVEQLYGAHWALVKINNRSLTGGVKIGLTAYDTCSSGEKALKQAITSLADVQFFQSQGEICRTKHILGFLGPSRASSLTSLASFLKQMNVSHVSLTLKSLTPEIQALVSVLSRLDWLHIGLIASDEALERDFLNAATKAQVCVAVSHVINKDRDFELAKTLRTINDSDIGAVVVLAYDVELKRVLRMAVELNVRYWHWLAAGPTPISGPDPELEGLASLADKMIVARSLSGHIPEFQRDFRNLIRSALTDRSKVPPIYWEYVRDVRLCEPGRAECPSDSDHLEGPGAMEAVRAIFRMAEAFRELLHRTCPDTLDFCPSLTSRLERKMYELLQTNKSRADDVFRELQNKVFNVSLYAYLPITRRGRDFQYIQVGQFYSSHLYLDTAEIGIIHPVGSGWFRIPDFRCRDSQCTCVNKEVLLIGKENSSLPPPRAWRRETWVTISVTISATGTIMALAILAYIIYKICRRDAVEGCQGMAMVLLCGVIALYTAVLPFALTPREVVCAIRIGGLGVSYALVFAPMVTRCLVLVTADSDGLPGHISGLLQTFLCFFMVAVQIAFASTYWWQNWGGHVIDTYNPLAAGTRCSFGTTDVAVSVSYPAFLLCVLFICSPFCVRNRRNYREGLLFHIASIVSLGVWIGWLLPFFAFSHTWQDPSICLGLVANASGILIAVFVPRIYKMATAYALDTATVSLRPVGMGTSASLTDVTARGSSNLIYESVNHGFTSEATIHTIKIGGNCHERQPSDEQLQYDVAESCCGHPKVTHL